MTTAMPYHMSPRRSMRYVWAHRIGMRVAIVSTFVLVVADVPQYAFAEMIIALHNAF